MNINNLLLSLITGLLSLFGIAIVIVQDFKLSQDPSIKERIGRALLGGIGVLIFVMSGLIAITYIALPTNENPWRIESLEALFCFTLPAVLLSIIGLFIRFSTKRRTLGYFSRKLDEIIQNSRKPKR